MQKEQVDVIFLDINMPEINGLSLLNLVENPPMVVFTTAYPEYAVPSYEYDAVDYLLKPFSLERFLKACQKVRERYVKSSVIQEEPILNIKADRKIHRLAWRDIFYLQAYGDYVKIKTKDGWIVPKARLIELETMLPPGQYLRTHRAYIVNPTHVKLLEGNQLLISKDHIPISKSHREQVLQFLGMS